MKTIFFIIFILFCEGILFLTLHGLYGNPHALELSSEVWTDKGPFELSPERARFALLYSVVEDRSLFFSLPIAKFSTPDLGYSEGNYVSLFAPGMSFLAIPGYLVGKILGISQVGVFATIAFFAFMNVLLIHAIATRLGANSIAATIGSLVFIFATPAFAYATTFYQHHVSVFLILLSLYVLLRWQNFWSLCLIWFLVALSIPIDYPNLVFMFPIALYAMARIIIVGSQGRKTAIRLKPIGFISLITIIFPLAFFLWFNQASYGSPFQLSGTVKSVDIIDENGMPQTAQNQPITGNGEVSLTPGQSLQKKTATGFFNTRKLLSGFSVHLISPDRGIILFAPVVLFGLYGIYIFKNKKWGIYSVLVGIIAANILLYSMWGDPWGGWAFGSRYLIPSYAIMSLFVAIALTKFGKNVVLLMIFFPILAYSIAVNTLGAVGSNLNPPKNETVALAQVSGKVEKYTFERNYDFIMSNHSKSFVFRAFATNFVSAREYYFIITVAIVLMSVWLLIMQYQQPLRKPHRKSLRTNMHSDVFVSKPAHIHEAILPAMEKLINLVFSKPRQLFQNI